jgi:hypothetical protein
MSDKEFFDSKDPEYKKKVAGEWKDAYNNNIMALKDINPEYTEQILNEGIKHNSRLSWDNDKLVYHSHGQSLLVHTAEAHEEIMNTTFFNTKKDSCTILLGIGDGTYFNKVIEMCDKNNKTKILIVEPVIHLLNRFLMKYDISESIKDKSVLIIPADPVAVKTVIEIVDLQSVISSWTIISDPLSKLWPQEYSIYSQKISDTINQIQCNTGTVMGAGHEMAKNDIISVPYIIKHRGVKEIEGLFEGLPAVIVSTGPSLSKNIHLLMNKKYREKCIVIAVAQAVRILFAYDIEPDFICTVDYGKTNAEHFNGIYDLCDKIPLVCLNKTYAEIMKKWKGPKFIVGSSSGYEGTVSSLITEKGSLIQGGSVSHMAFGLAHHLKCNPIILIGQDLGYESNLSHNPNADASGKIFHTDSGELAWQIDSPDSHLKSDTPYGMGGALLVDGYYGKPIVTNAGLLSFITSFEGLANMITDKALINSTEGGANIKGFARMTLQSAIDLYFKKRVDINKLAPFLTLADNWEDGIVNAIDVFKKEISEYKELVRCCKDAIKYAGMMDHHFNHPKKLNRDIKTNEEMSMKAENIAKKNPTITLSIYHASRRIFESDLNVEGKREDVMNDREKLKIRVKRNLHILNAAKTSAESLLPIYEEALILLEMVRDDNSHVLFEEDKYVPLHYDAKEYFDKGNFARPYCDVQLIERGRVSLLPVAAMTIGRDATALRDSAIEEAKKIKDPTERIKIAVGLEDAKRLGKAGKYQEAFDILIKIHNMAYKADIYHEELEWAIGSCAFVLYSRTQESKLLLQATTYFKGLTKKHPDNIQYKFDYANVILSTDFEKGMELLLPVVEDKRYDYFLKNIGRMYEEKCMYGLALESYRKYQKLYPNDVDIDILINSCRKKVNGD